MIKFFIDIQMPLTKQQIHAIGILHRSELNRLANYRARKAEKRVKRKVSLITNPEA
jgi:uncharacterized membrane protein